MGADMCCWRQNTEQDGRGRGGSIYNLLFLTSQRFLIVFRVRPSSPASSLRREAKPLMRKEAYTKNTSDCF